jgi:predicted nucleic acid-binding protein
MIVISDTSPINYLILIECVNVLPELYGRVVIPEGVLEELQRQSTPNDRKDSAAERCRSNYKRVLIFSSSDP